MSGHFERLVCWYHVEGNEFLVGSQTIIGVSHHELVGIFGEQPNDPDFFNCYPLTRSNFAAFRSYFQGEPDFESYQYFLEAQAAPA